MSGVPVNASRVDDDDAQSVTSVESGVVRLLDSGTVPRVQLTCFGKVRAFNRVTFWERVYLGVSLIAITTALGLTVERITVEKPCDRDFGFTILLILTIVSCYFYVVDSIFTERWDELLVFVVSNATVLAYCIINYCTGMHPTVKLVRLVLCSCFGPILIFGGIYHSCQYFRSNNLIHDTVGGLDCLQKACRIYYICGSLLKFNLQLQLSMSILVMGKRILYMSLTQILVHASGVPISFLVFLFGCLGIRKENKAFMFIFFLLSFIEPGYIIYRFDYIDKELVSVDETYYATFVCGGFALLIWILLVFVTIYFVRCHFGKGLKEKLFENTEADHAVPRHTSSRKSRSPSYGTQQDRGGTRMRDLAQTSI